MQRRITLLAASTHGTPGKRSQRWGTFPLKAAVKGAEGLGWQGPCPSREACHSLYLAVTMSRVLSQDLMKHNADFSSQSSPEAYISFGLLASCCNLE